MNKMNQTQTRSLRKRLLSLLLAVVLMIGLLPISAFASNTGTQADDSGTTAESQEFLRIFHLDCGRKYFTVKEIEGIIDQLAENHYTHIQLAFGNDGLRFLLDNMSFTANGTTYNFETIKSRVEAGNKAQNNSNDSRWLTETEMNEIIATAKSLGIEIVPLLNLPGHANAILDIAEDGYNVSGSDNTLDVANSKEAREFGMEILKLYVDYFAEKGCKYFNFGADEYANDIKTGDFSFSRLTSNQYQEFVAYVNEMAAYISSKKSADGENMVPRAFNDGMYYSNGTDKRTTWTFPDVNVDKNIQCCYWSSGWGSYPVAYASTVSSKGHAMINTHGDYYYVLGKNDLFTPGDSKAHDANLYTEVNGFSNNRFMSSTISSPVGSMFCIWCDDPTAETETEIARNVRLVMRAMALKMSGADSLDGMDTGEVKNGFRADGSLNVSGGETGEVKTEKDITVVVGGTETVSVSGNHEDKYTTENPNVATVTTKYSESTKQVVSETNATEIESGSQYLIIHQRSGLALNDTKSDDGLLLAANDNSQLWTITSNSSKSPYTANVKGVNGTSITSIGNGTATLGTDGSVTLNYTSGYWEIYSTSNWTTYYLNQYGGQNSSMAAGYSTSPNDDDGSRWRLFKVTPAATEQTTITFTGVSEGETSVVIGGVKYNIHVLSEDLAKVTPLKLEYWITNAPVTTVSGCETESRTNTENKTYTAYYKPIKATDKGVATAEGIDVKTPAPEETAHENRIIYYWRCRMLDTTLNNSSTSGTERQTNDSGDDETVNGVGFTKIRYYGGQWQVFTDAGQWVKTGNENQLVAYYREYIRVTDEVETYAADWGKRGDGTTTGDYLRPSAVNTISYQVVYKDGITNPTGTTAADLRSKTMCYGNWSPNRGVGTIMLQDTSNYEIYKVTAETGSMTGNSSTSGDFGNYTVTNFEWDGNEVAVWDEDTDSRETNGEIVIHNNAKNPTTEGFYGNLTWDENYESILIRVYVRAKVTEDSLTVNYYDRTDGTDKMFYSYNIAVNRGTFFDNGFEYVPGEVGKSGFLKNNTVVNINKVTQTVQWDLTKMTQIGAQYRYSDYVFVAANRSEDGKTVNLYYTFSASKTFVVDFGLPLVIKPVDVNTNLGNKGVTITKVSIGATSTYANITVDDQNYITYALKNKTTIDGKDTLSLQYSGQIPVTHEDGTESVQEGEVKYTLTIIPASNVYYEDSLASFADGKGVAKDATWSTVDNDDQTTTKDGGTDVYQALEELGKSGVYGYDKQYNSSSMLSMGTAHKVTVTSEMLANWKTDDTTSAWPTASFTFTGTGFDVISLTNNKSGAIFVDVYAGSKAEGKAEKKYVVNNYYGYTYNKDTKTWEVTPNVDNTLYQIPVMKITNLAYGEHTVVIKVAYSEYFDTANKSEYSFWLDAIRVYNPMGKDYDYTADNEGYPQYIKLRDEVVKKTATPNGNALFIDGKENAMIAEYANYGPNNEVYLMNGQAITFKIPQNANVDSIQIGAKAPDGKSASMVVNDDEKNAVPLKTATEMYYDITEQAKAGQMVTITNKSEGILSLTNLKITYKTKPAENEKVTLAALDTQEQENAVNLVRALFTAPVATFSPETFQASWGRAVRAGKRATLTVKTSADVDAITVDGVTVSSYTTRTERTGWGWWSPKVTYRVFTYTITATATADYQVCAVNSAGVSSEPVIATLTVRPATWWNWWF